MALSKTCRSLLSGFSIRNEKRLSLPAASPRDLLFPVDRYDAYRGMFSLSVSHEDHIVIGKRFIDISLFHAVVYDLKVYAPAEKIGCDSFVQHCFSAVEEAFVLLFSGKKKQEHHI